MQLDAAPTLNLGVLYATAGWIGRWYRITDHPVTVGFYSLFLFFFFFFSTRPPRQVLPRLVSPVALQGCFLPAAFQGWKLRGFGKAGHLPPFHQVE